MAHAGIVGHGVDVAAGRVDRAVVVAHVLNGIGRGVVLPEHMLLVNFPNSLPARGEGVAQFVGSADARGHLALGVGVAAAQVAPELAVERLAFGPEPAVGKVQGLLERGGVGRGGFRRTALASGGDALHELPGLFARDPVEGAEPLEPEGLVRRLPGEQGGVILEFPNCLLEECPGRAVARIKLQPAAQGNPCEEPVGVNPVQDFPVRGAANEVEAAVGQFLENGVILRVFIHAEDQPGPTLDVDEPVGREGDLLRRHEKGATETKDHAQHLREQGFATKPNHNRYSFPIRFLFCLENTATIETPESTRRFASFVFGAGGASGLYASMAVVPLPGDRRISPP